mgnify:CR=1 FL=1
MMRLHVNCGAKDVEGFLSVDFHCNPASYNPWPARMIRPPPSPPPFSPGEAPAPPPPSSPAPPPPPPSARPPRHAKSSAWPARGATCTSDSWFRQLGASPSPTQLPMPPLRELRRQHRSWQGSTGSAAKGLGSRLLHVLPAAPFQLPQ